VAITLFQKCLFLILHYFNTYEHISLVKLNGMRKFFQNSVYGLILVFEVIEVV